MATNELVIVLVDGTNGYIYDITANTFAQIASAMFANPQTVTYQDGYFLATFLETGTNKKRCQISADGITWNALDYRAIDTTPGALMRSLSFSGEVHQFADKGLEFWAYTGDPVFPFAPIRGATLPIGLAARWSVALGENSLYFLGRDRWRQRGAGVRARRAQRALDLDAGPVGRDQQLRHARRCDGRLLQRGRAQLLRALVPGGREDVDVRRLRLGGDRHAGVVGAASNGGRHLIDLASSRW
jgi:hypothetical protein